MEIAVRNTQNIIDAHDGRYEVQPSGVLVITLANGGQVAYSAVGWLSVETETA
jgi:hypothetical protein